MNEVKPLSIPLDDSVISGEYRPGRQIVLFSHGFDVRRDSLGLFTDIVKHLPDDWGYVLFDYHTYDEGGNEYLRSPLQQARALIHVAHWARTNLQPEQMHIVAHSMGCLVVSLAGETHFDTVVYLAPQLVDGHKLVDFFSNHPRLTRHDDHWRLRRRSGKTTHLSKTFLKEVGSLKPLSLHLAYAKLRPLTVIYGEQDKFVPIAKISNIARSSDVNVIGVPGDHNFTGIMRRLLIKQLRQTLGCV